MKPVWSQFDPPQLSTNNEIQDRELFQCILIYARGGGGGGVRRSQLCLSQIEDEMSLTPTISISSLYEPKSSSAQLIPEPVVAFWTVVALKGFCELHCCQAAGGNLFASANPLFLPSLSPSLCAPVCVFLSSVFSSSSSFPLSLSVPALLNISSYVSDTFAKISWTAREDQQDLQLYVAYMNNRKLLSLPHLVCESLQEWHHVSV